MPTIGKYVSLVLIAFAALAAPPARAQDKTPANATNGLKYWLAMDVIQVDVTVTTTFTKEYKDTQLKNPKGELVLKTSTKVTRDGTIASRTIADRSAQTYTIDVLTGKMSDNSVSVTVNSAGLLESVSAASAGRGAQILTSIAKFVGSVLAVVSFFPADVAVKMHLSTDSVNRIKKSIPDGQDFFGNRIDPKASKNVPDTCDPFAPPFTTLPMRARAFTSLSEPGCELFWQIRRQDIFLADLRGQRAALEAKLETTAGADLDVLRAKIKDRTAAISAEEKIQADYQSRFNALFDAFVADKELGTTTEVKKFAIVLSLDEIPLNIADLHKFPKVVDLFNRTGVLVLARSNAPLPATGKSGSGGNQPQQLDSKTMRIMFRQPSSWVIEARATNCNTDDKSCMTQPVTEANTDLQSLTPVDLIKVGTDPSYVEFEAKAFSDGKVAMTFERGHPIRLERGGTASLASIATGLADAARTAQTSYAEGLASVVEIQKSKRAIETSEINAQIEDAKKQKELLDAKLAATGAGQSFDMMLQQNDLNQRLGLLQAQAALKAAEAAQDQKLEIEALKRELDKVKTQIDLLTAQQQYNELQKNKKE
jgi:hypothetical protein